MIDYKSFLHVAAGTRVTRDYWYYDARGVLVGEPLSVALLIVAKPYKDIVWC